MVILAMVALVPAALANAAVAPTRIYVANAGNPSSVTVLNGATNLVEKSVPIRNGIAVGVGNWHRMGSTPTRSTARQR